jgi:uncharacterized membrane protein required for colicin V production
MTTRTAESQPTRTGTWLRYTHRVVSLVLLSFGLVCSILVAAEFYPLLPKAISSMLAADTDVTYRYYIHPFTVFIAIGSTWFAYRCAKQLAALISTAVLQ